VVGAGLGADRRADVYQRRRIIPSSEALLAKGCIARHRAGFMMSVIALSLPEMVILRKVLSSG